MLQEFILSEGDPAHIESQKTVPETNAFPTKCPHCAAETQDDLARMRSCCRCRLAGKPVRVSARRRMYATARSAHSVIEVYAGAVPNDIRIGMRGGTVIDQRFDGLVDEVEIFDRALTAAEIQAIFDAGGAGKCKAVTVEIDIKPGSDPNSINLCSGGAVPVAILGSDTFDVLNVDTETLRFAEAAVKVVGKKDPNTLCSYNDVNGDSWVDLVCHYTTQDIAALDGESSTANVNGELLPEFGATPIEGTDSVNIVKDTCN